jgi:hypothetical protein
VKPTFPTCWRIWNQQQNNKPPKDCILLCAGMTNSAAEKHGFTAYDKQFVSIITKA